MGTGMGWWVWGVCMGSLQSGTGAAAVMPCVSMCCWGLYCALGQILFPGLFAAENPSFGAAAWCVGKHSML